MNRRPFAALAIPLASTGLGLPRRWPRVEEGRAADLAVFDPAVIRGTATVDNPNQFSAGIELVLVNGRIAYQDGALAERGGTAVRY